ncbi:hypothetical protein HAX54_029304 [Datura stramonium]|uniref:Uncharacterized protein n=1 Tax=Datura stramonium TaxID=4076 RepID=A0ABS8V5X5_DATST|nr:hypothetical protein [Datura stramonium]
MPQIDQGTSIYRTYPIVLPRSGQLSGGQRNSMPRLGGGSGNEDQVSGQVLGQAKVQGRAKSELYKGKELVK